MNKRRFSKISLLLISLGLNGALVIAAIQWRTSTPVVPVIETRSVPSTNSASTAAVSEAPEFNYVTNQFHWRSLESTNFEEYVANLRSVGCPEKTVRDILLAELRVYYANREREIMREPSFWLAGKARREAWRKMNQERVALAPEKEALLARLGIEPGLDDEIIHNDRFRAVAMMRFLLGPMSDEKVYKMVSLIARQEVLEKEMRVSNQGIETEEDEARMVEFYRMRREESAALLSPVELEEFAARMASLQLFFGDHRAAIELTALTAYELRQIMVLKTGGGRYLQFPDDKDEDKEWDAERQAQFNNGMPALLGPDRFALFTRAQDGDFKPIHDFTKQTGLAADVAVKVYDLRKAAAEEIKALREDTMLDNDARQDRLREIQDAMQATMSDVLGSAYDSYLNQGGSWVTNANQL